MQNKSLRLLAYVFTLAVITLFLTTNTNSSIGRGDETIHTRVVQEMAFENGSALQPRFFNNLYLNKPPLQFWFSAPLVRVLGDHNFAYRIVPAVAGLVLCLMLFYFSRVLFGSPYPGMIACLLALGGKQVIFDHGLRVGTMDTLLLLCSTVAMVCLWLALTTEKKKWIFATGVLVGLACLTKWVAGLVPWMVLGCLVLVDKASRDNLKRHFPAWLLAGFLSVLIPGLFVGYHLLHDYQITVDTLRLNIGERLVGKGYHNQDDTWLYFSSLFKGEYGNFALLMFGVAFSVFAFLGFVFSSSALSALAHRKRKFLLVWAIVPLILYTNLHSRLPWYYLPATPALWLLAGWSCTALIQSFSKWRAVAIVLGLALGVIIARPLWSNFKRIQSAERLTLDGAVEEILKSKPTSVSFAGLSPKDEGSLAMSRRYLFYLNRLALHSDGVRYLAPFQPADSDILVLPYSRLEEADLPSYKAILCPPSDFKKPYDRVCILSKAERETFSPIGVLVDGFSPQSSWISGISITRQASKSFAIVSGRVSNIALPLESVVSQYNQVLSINAAVNGSNVTVAINGQYLGELPNNNALTTTQFRIPHTMVVSGTNVLTVLNDTGTITKINWVSLRPSN